jgi:hypothetical protein
MFAWSPEVAASLVDRPPRPAALGVNAQSLDLIVTSTRRPRPSIELLLMISPALS